jgi:hypothetical protein
MLAKLEAAGFIRVKSSGRRKAPTVTVDRIVLKSTHMPIGIDSAWPDGASALAVAWVAWPDFEDAVCAAAAEACACDAIVTRDPDGYPEAPLPVIDAAAAFSWLAEG